MKKILLLTLLCSVTLMMSARQLEDKWILCTNSSCQLLDPYYEDGVSFTWEGEVVNNKAHGNGTATRYINGVWHSTYVGNYENGKRVGKATMTWADGREMECEFVNNQATGSGTISFRNGDVYTGEFINYIIHGNGVYEKANGVLLEGSFVNGELYTGKVTLVNDSVIYLYKDEISEVEIHALSVRMAGELPRNEKNDDSYDMVSHPLLQMSTSHIVVKHKRCSLCGHYYYLILFQKEKIRG